MIIIKTIRNWESAMNPVCGLMGLDLTSPDSQEYYLKTKNKYK